MSTSTVIYFFFFLSPSFYIYIYISYIKLIKRLKKSKEINVCWWMSLLTFFGRGYISIQALRLSSITATPVYGHTHIVATLGIFSRVFLIFILFFSWKIQSHHQGDEDESCKEDESWVRGFFIKYLSIILAKE